MAGLQKFFLFCSGAHDSVLKRTPTELNKYVGIGATIFFTGVFAAIAGAYAIFTVFQSYLIALAFGMLWGLMIFNLDRYIVSTMKKKGSFWRDFGSAFPRIVLAVLIAIVIAKPLELKIFDSEIRSELALMQQENYKQQEALVNSRFTDELELAKTELAALKTEINDQVVVRDRLDAIAIQEADGTGGSLRRNMGPIYLAKKDDALRAQEELTRLEEKNAPLIAAKQNRIGEIESSKATELANMERVQLTGFAARIDALDRLGSRSDAIYWAGLFIMLLFIAIETAPVFVKLITQRSPYDYVLDKHEHKVAMNHRQITTSLSYATKNQLDFELETGQYKTRLAIKAEKEIAEQALNDQLERLKKNPFSWKELVEKGRLFGIE